MTLVVGRRFDDLTYLIADTGSSIPLTSEKLSPFMNPLAKVLINSDAAIAYSGNTSCLPDVYSIGDRVSSFAALVRELTHVHRGSDGKIDFLVVNLCTRALTRISDGTAEEVTTAYIGSQKAFALLQRARHRSESIPSTEFCMIMLPEVSEKSAQTYATDLRAFYSVLQEEPHEVGGFAVPFFVESNKCQFGIYAMSTRRPIEWHEVTGGKPRPVSWQGAPEGAYSINFGGSERSFACYIREGLIGIEWNADFGTEPTVHKALEWRFIQSMHDKYGIGMIKRHGHPIDPIINALIVARNGDFPQAVIDIDFAIECIVIECRDENGKQVKLKNNSLWDTFQDIREIRIPIGLVGYLQHCLDLRKAFLNEFASRPQIETAVRDADIVKQVLGGEFAIAKRVST